MSRPATIMKSGLNVSALGPGPKSGRTLGALIEKGVTAYLALRYPIIVGSKYLDYEPPVLN